MKTLDNCAFSSFTLMFELDNVILLLRPSLLTINAFIFIFRFKQSAYCTGNMTNLLINTLSLYVCNKLGGQTFFSYSFFCFIMKTIEILNKGRPRFFI